MLDRSPAAGTAALAFVGFAAAAVVRKIGAAAAAVAHRIAAALVSVDFAAAALTAAAAAEIPLLARYWVHPCSLRSRP